MVNIEEFSNRLKKILEYYDLSASSFAEKLEVQRSSISHLLSGRNKPSLDFVLKVLKTFPEVELYWLLNGTGTFPKNETVKDTTLFSKVVEKEKEIIPTPKIENQNSNPSVELKTEIRTPISDKEIERIIIFFKDGSFKNYTP